MSARSLALGLAVAVVLLIVPGAAAAKFFPNCKAVNKVYAHGDQRLDDWTR